MGMGTARLAYGGGVDAALLNPAFLGAELQPWGGLRLIPLVGSYSAGYWSDKLALTPYREIFNIDEDGQWQEIVTQVINSSFRLAEDSPEQSSEKICDIIEGGTSVYSGVNISLLSLVLGKIGLDVRTAVDAQVDLPDAPFLIIFSDDAGLKSGSDLSLTDLAVQVRATTDIHAAYGRTLNLSRIAEYINTFTRKVTDFKYASGGLGLTLSLGHGLLSMQTEEASIEVAEDGTSMSMNADMNLKTAGTGSWQGWKFDFPYENYPYVNGWGFGINAGVMLYGEHSTISIALRRFGPMIWHDVMEGDFELRTQDMVLDEILSGDDPFDSQHGGRSLDEDDTLYNAGRFCEWQPTSLNIGLGYRFNFRHNERKAFRALSEYINTSLEYEQSLAPWPGRSFVPRIALGAENGFLWGWVPFRVGFIFGGAEKLASTAGFAIGMPTFSMQLGYKAVGTPYWYPRRGFEFSLGFSTEWKRFRDPDRDGIRDNVDLCAYGPEDFDGYEDEDGCIDPDNDGDGIADTLDQCPNIAEDMDGFEDEDGCPDFDNDKDGVADTLDSCPEEAEDVDGFEDEDGCPDWDNDQDGLADSVDQCPGEPEDVDGVEDDDGCPEIDADGDMIVDSLDSCPEEREVYNFVDDTDGCPDSVRFFTPGQNQRLSMYADSISFDRKGKLDRKSHAALDTVASILGAAQQQRYFLCWCDTSLSDSLIRYRSQVIADSLADSNLTRERLIIPDCGSPRLSTSVTRTCGGFLRVKLIQTRGEYRRIMNLKKRQTGLHTGSEPESPDRDTNPDVTKGSGEAKSPDAATSSDADASPDAATSSDAAS
ncbi:MAG: DUF5723 family protein, partial [Chitinispirillaceae bacterium]